jgi:hypothetical protein
MPIVTISIALGAHSAEKQGSHQRTLTIMTRVEYLLFGILASQVVNMIFDTRRNRQLLEYLFDIRKVLQRENSEEDEL